MVNYDQDNQDYPLRGASIFLSASIPDKNRWDGKYQSFEITDAVVALTRIILQNGGSLVTAVHPTISPLLLFVAAEQLRENDQRIIIYQSEVFKDILPAATKSFEANGFAKIIWTKRCNSEPANPVQAPESLKFMRNQMLIESKPIAAVFIGGMNGILDEYKMFHGLYPQAPTYAFGQPGGEAKKLVAKSPHHLCDELSASCVYPTLARHIVTDLVENS